MEFRNSALLILVLALIFPCILRAQEGDFLIGTPAPEWENSEWINSKPLRLSQLKEKVVLIRFFMESTCPMCRASAPYLNEFHSQYKDVVVIGMYTPKPRPAPTLKEKVQKYARDYGFQFPVALDTDWQTLKKYWLDRVKNAEFTSVSFILDQHGIIQYIHPGGAYSTTDVAEMKNILERLLRVDDGAHVIASQK